MAFSPLRRRSPSDATASNESPSGGRALEKGDADPRDREDLRRDFEALMARYQQPIYNTIIRLVGDPEEASDLTQETFLSAYRASADFRGEAKVSTWLYRIAVNHCKNRFKQRDRLRQHEGPSLDEGQAAEDGPGETRAIADWSLSPELLLEQKELRAVILRAVDALPLDYKTVLVLREMESMNYNEISDVLGISMESVKTRLSRARAMVRRRVEPYYRMG